MLLCAVLLAWSTPPRADDQQVLNELRRLVDSGQHQQAMQFAGRHPGLLGNPHFDFLYGLAAINANRLPEGLLALERHLSTVPANDRARLELARGYFELGEYARARQEFEFVLRYNPPAEVRTNIQRYLDAMRAREAVASRATRRTYLEIGAGHDSNVNAGTYNDWFRLFERPIDDPLARAIDSPFVRLGGGGQWLKRIDARLAVYAGVDFDVKHNSSATRFDTGNLSGHLGFSVLKGPGLYRLSLADAQMWVDGERYRNTLSLSGEGQFSLGQGYTANAVAQYAELGYAAAHDHLDAKLSTLGGGVRKTLNAPWRPSIGAQLTWAREINLNKLASNDRDMRTARLSLAASPTPKLSINFDLSRQSSDFGAASLPGIPVREDLMWTAEAGINYLLDKHWLLRADVSHTDNDSNLDLFAYRRWLVGVRARHLF